MGITHLHMTDGVAAHLEPSTRRLLDDSGHFNLLIDMQVPSGTRHRVFEVLPGAGTTEVVPASYRALRQLLLPRAPVSVLGALPHTQRWAIFSAFADHDDLQSSTSIGFDRGTLIPQVETLKGPPEDGVVVLPEPARTDHAQRVARRGAVDRSWRAHLRPGGDLVSAVAHRA